MATKFTHRRTFDHPFDQVFSAFTDKDAIEAMLAEIGGTNSALLAYDRSADEVRYKLRQGVPHEKLPSVVRTLRAGDMMVEREQTWTRVDDAATVDVTAAVSGVPGSITATSNLRPSGEGCTMEVEATLALNIPLVGGKIEKSLADKVDYLLSKEDDFVADRLADE